VKILDLEVLSANSRIVVNDSISNIHQYLNHRKTIIITDENVYSSQGHCFPDYPIIRIGMGEGIKNLQTAEMIFEQFIRAEVDRTWFVLGIGGGIVCDITGFVASTYMRGLAFGFIASSLLAQVDASVGGKNGVNFMGYKNMVGTFAQPEFVVCDFDLLKSLPQKEIKNGLAEIVKHTVIGKSEMFSYLENHYKKVLTLNPMVLENLIYESIMVKSAIVSQDEKERGERKKLNFGHTFGHAFEKTAAIPHGEAVSIGMVLAARLSCKRGLINPADVKRIIDLLVSLKLPVSIQASKTGIYDAIRRDKKRKGNSISFVLLNRIGEAVLQEISLAEIEEVVHDLC